MNEETRRNTLIIDIIRWAITITETKDFTVDVDIIGFVGCLRVTLYNKGIEERINLIDTRSCFNYPAIRQNPLQEEDFKELNEKLEKCLHTLNDLLIGKLTFDDLRKQQNELTTKD